MYEGGDQEYDYIFKADTKGIGKVFGLLVAISMISFFVAYLQFDMKWIQKFRFTYLFDFVLLLFVIALGIAALFFLFFIYSLKRNAFLKINKKGIYLHPFDMIYWDDIEDIEIKKKCYLYKTGSCLFLKLKEGVGLLKSRKGFMKKLYFSFAYSMFLTPVDNLEIGKDIFEVDLQELLKILKEYKNKHAR